MMSVLEKVDWLEIPEIRPYVFVRTENRISQPGTRHNIDWFGQAPLYKNPLAMRELDFADGIFSLENKAFSESGMEMPRWVFYDCAIVPGFVAGFAAKTEWLSKSVREVLEVNPHCEWTPLSLFITIPTMGQAEWVAHNLCSVNSLLPREERFYGLGFMTKAFGLWYANIEKLIGMTQWTSPAVRLHTFYGDFEVLTAYTPVHSYAHTLTYRSRVDSRHWAGFFFNQSDQSFSSRYHAADIQVAPEEEASLKALQLRLENGQGPYFLQASEVKTRPDRGCLKVYTPIETS